MKYSNVVFIVAVCGMNNYLLSDAVCLRVSIISMSRKRCRVAIKLLISYLTKRIYKSR